MAHEPLNGLKITILVTDRFETLAFKAAVIDFFERARSPQAAAA